MLKTQIGSEGIGPRKTFWVRLHLSRPWQGPFTSYLALSDAIQRVAGIYLRPDQLEDLIEAFPRGGATQNFVIVPGPRDHPPGRGFQNALGFRRPRRLPEDKKNLAALLQALGTTGRARGRRLGRRDIVSIVNTRAPMAPLVIDGDFTGRDLPRISTRRSKEIVEFRGDFTDAEWFESVFMTAVFSGRGRRGNFAECEFTNSVLSGDLAEAVFRGITFNYCAFEALLDGADLRNTVMEMCEVRPTASARGADLRGAILWFRNAEQIRAARVLLNDLIAVRCGAIELLGEPCVLFRPVQVVPGIRILNDAGQRLPPVRRPPAEFFDSLLRREGPVIPNDDDHLFLWDLADSEFRGVHAEPVGICTLNLHAPRSLFRELPEIQSLRLNGVFDDSSFERCVIRQLVISFGSFKRFDLNSAWIDSLAITMANTDVCGLRLPAREDQMISFVWYGHDVPPVCHPYLHSCSLSVGLAQVVLNCWSNPDGCDWLARQLLRQAAAKPVSKYPVDMADRALAFAAKTGEEIAQAATDCVENNAGPFSAELVAAFHLVAQRNRLRALQIATAAADDRDGSAPWPFEDNLDELATAASPSHPTA